MGRFFRRLGSGAAAALVALTVALSPAAASSPRLLQVLDVPPVGVADFYTTPYETRLDVDDPGVLANDIDPDSNTIYAKLVSGTSHGVLELREEGRLRYEPDNGFSGTDSFTYLPYDGTSAALLAVSVTIIVKPRPPASPTPKPTPSPTPTPTPTLALPTLPLPTLPLPTIGLPALPTPTPVPTLPPVPGTTPAPAAGPTAAPTPAPDSSNGPSREHDPSASAGPAALAIGSSSDGSGPLPPGLSVAPAESTGGGSSNVGPIAFGSFGTIGLGIEWVVPTVLLTVPGFLLLLIGLGQVSGGLLWLPLARRWLRGDGRPMEARHTRGPELTDTLAG